MFQNKIEFQALNKGSLKIVLVFVIFAFGLVCVSSTAVAEDEDEDNNDFKDRAKNLGVAALGLFSVSIVYVFFYQIFINSKKILPKIQRKSCPKTINLMNGVLKFRKHF